MSTEVITAVAAVFSTVALVFTGMFTLFRRFETRIEKRFEERDRRMDERFAERDRRLDEKFAERDRRMDERFAASDKLAGERFTASNERFAAADKRADGRFTAFDQQFATIHEEINALRSDVRTIAADVVDLKVAVARIEGPRQNLIRAT